MEMKQHVTIVAALHIGMGALGVLIGLFVFVILMSVGIYSGDQEAFPILTAVAITVGGFLALLGLPGIVGGIGLLKYRNWARILVMVVSAFNVLNIPFGTALAVYSFWVLVHPDVVPLFGSRPAAEG